MSVRKVLFILYLGCSVLPYSICFAQQDQSALLQQWHQQKQLPGYASDSTSVLLLNKIANSYMYDQPDSTVYFGNEALTLAQEQQYQKGEMKAQYLMGLAYYVKGSYSLALDRNSKALQLSLALLNTSSYASVLNTVGLVYIGQHQYESAIDEFSKAVRINTARKDSAQLTKNYFNIGLCYDETGKYDSAITYLEKVIRMGEKTSDYRLIVMSYNRLGETYFHRKDYQKALDHYQMVLQNTNYKSNWENSFAYSGIGQTHFALGNYQKSVENSFKGFEFARDMNAKWDMERSLRILSQGYEELKNFEEAYRYHTLYKAYSDSLYNEAKEREINFLHLQQKEVENQQLLRENQLQQQENRLSKLIILIISLVALFVLIVAILIYRSSKQKLQLNNLLLQRNIDIAEQKEQISEQNEALTALNSTKDQILSVVSHDLKSPFASIMGTFDLISQDLLNAEEQKVVFAELHRKVVIVSEMLNNLLYWANNQQKSISAMKSEVDLVALAEETLTVYVLLAGEKNIVIRHKNESSKLIYADPDHVKIILQNILGNAIKFTPEAGQIDIFYTEDEPCTVLHVKDNGVGIAAEKLEKLFLKTGRDISSAGTNQEKGTGIGLMLVKQFVEGNQGSLKVNSTPGEGSEFMVYFKKYRHQEVINESEVSTYKTS